MSRVLLRSLAALVLTVVAGLIGWRVLAPAEVLSAASTPYPNPSVGVAQVTGRANMAPLIVDGRMRVYAGKRQVRADGPVDARRVSTARWSLRRWPVEVSGVVASGTTVISRWSDGLLIAIDGRTGKEVWRVPTGLPSPGYEGHRTGASVVWAPPGLWVSDQFVLVKGGQRLSAYEVGSGARRWSVEVPAGCDDGLTTRGGQFLCGTAGFSVSTGEAITPYVVGPLTPLSCVIGFSECAALRDGQGRGYLTSPSAGAEPAAAAGPDADTGLDPTSSPKATPDPKATPTSSPRSIATSNPQAGPTADPQATPKPGSPGPLRREPGLDNSEMSVTGTGLGRVPPGDLLLGVSRGRMVVLTASRHLQIRHAGRGGVEAEFPLAVDTEKLTWKPGLWQVTDDWVAIERLTEDGPADPEAPEHYFTVDTVIIASLR
ncbi:outer membrane protein assembly factor BamB family protein [Paractinoplanes brasiliensis]|uniref:Putative pyrroloquinoline-quinone binding quinoprotein n=1 Tax=Paractinoplanes brasiliensis TaxID=52695 RepID=A0A4R6JUQ1_9ACTN|nr:PQQ-binding-like beta-propeller repeat protein [Actinoplanes brasiliensis]TDO39907.1 putative pyrroloquinoline-quinone binding quinoprotein [Actinoplanes brasiliensis]GID31527.1 hypothetical protein Abr02nite_65100 [Actinoplanes brasiliensis]